ncbi:MAG: cupin domain-containing protein [Anaerolineae bacterium]|nr:cupin domain-containing protein [Anaerolineae bacterium]
MNKYPHTIENGAGEQITFRQFVSDPTGDWLEGENLVQPGAGPPMHVHYLQEEGLTVLKGRLGYQLADREPQYAGEGETAVFKPGEVHRFWNAGEGELHCTSYVKPADNLEYFLSAIFDSQKQNGGRQPDSFDVAYLLGRYKDEFGLVEIPGFVQRFIFPIVVMLGKLLGKYRKYADAPEPVKQASGRNKGGAA